MTAQRRPVVARHKDYELFLATIADFTVGPVEDFDATALATDPRLSLYSLDLAAREAIFVETPGTVDLTTFPFLYVAQFRHATHVVTVSFETLHQVADAVRPTVAEPNFIHSVGRCGSTLVSKALEAVPEVCSLSEPDVFSQLTEWRGAGELTRDESLRLAESCVRVVCKPMVGPPGRRIAALKFRAQCIEIADLLTEAFPAARQLYLTRAPLDWLDSAHRAFVDPEHANDHEFKLRLEVVFSRMHPLLREFRTPGRPMPAWKTWMLVWIANVETHQRLRAAGINFLEADYAQLQSAPQETMRRIFEHCSIPMDSWDAVVASFARDAQAGSTIARSEVNTTVRQLPPSARAGAEALLRSRRHLPQG